MKILMLVNWKVLSCKETPNDKQPPDYRVEGEPYWFYRYFNQKDDVDIIDISSASWLENFEREKLRFYVLQALKAIPKLHKYDLIVSHGMQSAVVVCLYRRFFRGKEKHIVFDIGSFNSAAESGSALKLMQFASRSIDGLIYHTSAQHAYYEKFFPWLVEKSQFVRFGTDGVFWKKETDFKEEIEGAAAVENSSAPYILCVGYIKRDWDTLYRAYAALAKQYELQRPGFTLPVLRMVGKAEYQPPEGERLPECAKLELIPYIPVRELMTQIQNAQFCVLPLESFLYSYGQMTLLQQMALGKAVIVAKVPSMLDYVQDGENACFYEAKNASDLCGKMEDFLKNPERRETIGSNAADYVKRVHNEKDMALQIEAFYDSVLKG